MDESQIRSGFPGADSVYCNCDVKASDKVDKVVLSPREICSCCEIYMPHSAYYIKKKRANSPYYGPYSGVRVRLEILRWDLVVG